MPRSRHARGVDERGLVERVTNQAYGATDSDYRPERWASYREPRRLSGHEDDVEVGLVYFGARYYSPNLKQWTSADPLTVHGLGSTFNPYTYVGGSPVERFDWMGLDEGQDPSGGGWEGVVGGIVGWVIDHLLGSHDNTGAGSGAGHAVASPGGGAATKPPPPPPGTLAPANPNLSIQGIVGVYAMASWTAQIGILRTLNGMSPTGPLFDTVGDFIDAASAVAPNNATVRTLEQVKTKLANVGRPGPSAPPVVQMVDKSVNIAGPLVVGAVLVANGEPVDLPAGVVEDAISEAKAAGGGPTRFINGVRVVDRRAGTVLEGTVDLKPTLDRIASGGRFPHRNDGSIFQNRPLPGRTSPELPAQAPGYYREYVHPTPGVSGPGPQRVVVGQGGEMFYTPDHYQTFIPLQ